MCRCEIKDVTIYFSSRQTEVSLFTFSVYVLHIAQYIKHSLFLLCVERIQKNKTDILRTIVDSAAWMYKKGLESHQEVRDFEYKKIGDI
jgi:hypothetical protein